MSLPRLDYKKTMASKLLWVLSQSLLDHLSLGKPAAEPLGSPMERSMEPGLEACKQLRKGACKQILLPAIIKSVGTQSSPCRAPGRWISSPTRKVVQGGAMAVSVKRWEPWGSKITSPESSWKQEFLVQHSSYPTNIQVSREKLFSPVIKGVSRTSFFSLH